MNIYTVNENGISMDGSGKVCIPACKVKASSFLEATEKLSLFLKTRKLTSDIELITPMHKIQFEC